jgi:hypothetical protein
VGVVPQLEVDTSAAMQDYILGFIKEPMTVNATSTWPKFDANATNGGAILEFGKDVAVKTVTGDYVDGSCWNSSATYPFFG